MSLQNKNIHGLCSLKRVEKLNVFKNYLKNVIQFVQKVENI